METSDSSTQQSSEERLIAPTVSREKWRNHVVAKLARGYVLIVGKERRTANFFLPGKGYEMCAHDIARKLVREGVIVKAYDHDLGIAYTLAAPPPTQDLRPAALQRKAPDEMDALLDQLAQDGLEDDEDPDSIDLAVDQLAQDGLEDDEDPDSIDLAVDDPDDVL